jgi:hypothetical protein
LFHTGAGTTPICRSQIGVLTPFMEQIFEACGS